MTGTGAGRSRAPQTEGDVSSGLWARLRLEHADSWALRGVLALGVLAGLMLIAAEFLDVYRVYVGGTSCEAVASPDVSGYCATIGLSRHLGALIVLGLFSIAMAWGASAGGSRPAGAALLLVGGVVLVIALLGDLPDVSAVGVVGTRYAAAKAAPGPGFWLELVGAVVALAAGALRVTRST